MKRLSFTQRIIAKYQASGLRPYFRFMEEGVRQLLRGRARILFGPMRGYVFPKGDRGMLLGTYESQIQEVLQTYLSSGDVFYDVGAHHGYLSLLGCVLVGSEGHVYSFEPIPANAAILQQVMTLNRINNHTLTPAAVSNEKGTTELFLGDGNDYRASMFPWKSGNCLKVETLTLNDFIQGHRLPRLVKMDVEGAEALVLEGAGSLLSNPSAPAWVIEVHSEAADQALGEIFKTHRYRCRYLVAAKSGGKPYPRHLIAEKE